MNFFIRSYQGKQYVLYCNLKCKKPRTHSFECNQSLLNRNRHIIVVLQLGKFCNRLGLGGHEIFAFLHICKQGISHRSKTVQFRNIGSKLVLKFLVVPKVILIYDVPRAT